MKTLYAATALVVGTAAAVVWNESNQAMRVTVLALSCGSAYAAGWMSGFGWAEARRKRCTDFYRGKL